MEGGAVAERIGLGFVLYYKRLEVGHFAAPWKRPGEGPLQLTMNELALLFEGSELALRVRLSPAPYRPMADGAYA
jgi:transposase